MRVTEASKPGGRLMGLPVQGGSTRNAGTWVQGDLEQETNYFCQSLRRCET